MCGGDWREIKNSFRRRREPSESVLPRIVSLDRHRRRRLERALSHRVCRPKRGQVYRANLRLIMRLDPNAAFVTVVSQK